MRIALFYPHIHREGGYPRDVRRLSEELRTIPRLEVTTFPADVKSFAFKRLGFAEAVLAPQLLKQLGEVDLVHFFGLFFPFYPLIAKMVRAAGKPYIVSPMCALEPLALLVSARKKALFMNALGRAFLNGAAMAHVFAPSEAASIRAAGCRTSITEIPLGIYFEDAPSNIEVSANRTPQDDYFLFFGRLGYYQKGIDILLDGFRRYVRDGGRIALIIAGRSWNGSDRLIERRIAELGIEQYARFAGEVSTSQKFALMRMCRAFVYPTRHDGPPRPVRDALALRKPLLVSRQANMCSSIDEMGWGYEFNAEPTELANAMHRMEREYTDANYHDPELEMNWATIARRYSEMYVSAI